MPSAFESGERKLIPAVLIYVRCGDDILMICRDSRVGDYHAGKWNGLGGKLEPDESPLEAARRELIEEAGVELPLDSFRSLGGVHFPCFKAARGEDWIAFVFEARVSARPSLRAGDEGSLHWIPSRDLLSLNLWAGDRHFLPFVLEGRPFLGTLWYRGQEVLRHSIFLL
jgi:8-oxo-dGTP diphosphatase